MRTRFCATIRKPAFSMRALIAPVRLRAVASGLMIEKVRSIAIVSPVCGKAARAGRRGPAYKERGNRPQLGRAMRGACLTHVTGGSARRGACSVQVTPLITYELLTKCLREMNIASSWRQLGKHSEV